MSWSETGRSPEDAVEMLKASSNVLSTISGGGLTLHIEDLIRGATDGEVLRVISPIIDDPQIVRLICQARERGVIVRVLTTLVDRHGVRTKGWDASQDVASHDECIRRLAKSGVLLRSPITTPHAKFIHLSEKQAIFGSANLAKGSLRGHALEVALQISDVIAMRSLADAFDEIWKLCPYFLRSRAGTITIGEAAQLTGNALPLSLRMDDMELLLSFPCSSIASDRLSEIVTTAQREIVLMAMSLYDTDTIPRFGDALLEALNRGVRVLTVVRPEHFPPSQYPDKATIELIRSGMELTGITGLHAKGFLVDGDWCGIQSANFNPFSLDATRPECNVEMLLIGHATSPLLRDYSRFFELLSGSATHIFSLD